MSLVTLVIRFLIHGKRGIRRENADCCSLKYLYYADDAFSC